MAAKSAQHGGEALLTIVTLLAASVASRAFPTLTFALFLIFLMGIVIALVSLVLASLYIKKVQDKVSKRLLTILSWSNVVAWLLPALGVFISAATWRINAENKDADHTKYTRLALTGIILTIASVLIRAVLQEMRII